MATLLELCFGLVYLATVIHGEPDHEQLLVKLNQMARDNVLIDQDFRPVNDGYINKGTFGVVFKGERVSDNITVAMKFVTKSHKNETDREYEMYSYLDAIDNPKIEEFGLCCIYLYADWNEYKLMIFTYLSANLDRPARAGYFNRNKKKNGINSLILFRDFVRQSKYLHSHGVRHDDVKPENIMIHKHRSFLIDFNLSSRMNVKYDGGSLLYGSRRFHNNQKRSALDDWESFLYSMCHINHVPLTWFFNTAFLGLSPRQLLAKFRELKANTTTTVAKIEKAIKCEPLKRVFMEFAIEVFQDNTSVPNYDRLEVVINEAIDAMVLPPEPVLFTWIESDLVVREEAINDLLKSPMRNARDINPSNDFGWIQYPRVNYKYFQNKRTGQSMTLSQRIISSFINLMTVCDQRNYADD